MSIPVEAVQAKREVRRKILFRVSHRMAHVSSANRCSGFKQCYRRGACSNLHAGGGFKRLQCVVTTRNLPFGKAATPGWKGTYA